MSPVGKEKLISIRGIGAFVRCGRIYYWPLQQNTLNKLRFDYLVSLLEL